jgi:hypothetical protein
MKTILLAALVAIGVSLPGCPGCTQVKTVADDCAVPAVMNTVAQILPLVIADLLSGNYAQLLSDLIATLKSQGMTNAITAVTCAVKEVTTNSPTKMGRSVPSSLTEMYKHADDWLKHVPQ